MSDYETVELSRSRYADMHRELAYLRRENKRLEQMANDRAKADAAYISWSLGGGPLEGIFAGMEIQRGLDGTKGSTE